MNLADAVQQNKRWANSLNLQLIPAWTRLSSVLLKADLISPDEFRRRKDAGVEYAKELVGATFEAFSREMDCISRGFAKDSMAIMFERIKGTMLLYLRRKDVTRRPLSTVFVIRSMLWSTEKRPFQV